MLRHASIATIRRYWVAIASLAVLGAVLAFGISLAITPLYRATASLYFTLGFGDSAGALAQGSTYTTNQMTSFGQLVTSPVVLQPVIDDLNLDIDANDLASAVSVSTPRDTVIMEISVTSVDPASAADTANAIAIRVSSIIEDYAPPMTDGRPSVEVRTIAEAAAPNFQYAPNKRVNTAAGFAVGGLVGVLGAFAFSGLDTRVRHEHSVSSATSARFLGTVQSTTEFLDWGPADGSGQASDADQFRRVRAALDFSVLNGYPLVLLVTSPGPDEGASTVPANLAAALAEPGRRALIVDGPQEPCLPLDTAPAPGLAAVLQNQMTLADAVRPVPGAVSLDYLPAGSLTDPESMITRSRMVEVLQAARVSYDVVVVNSSDLRSEPVTLMLAMVCDGVVLVARSGVTHKSALASAVAAVEGVGGAIHGVIIDAGRKTSAEPDAPSPAEPDDEPLRPMSDEADVLTGDEPAADAPPVPARASVDSNPTTPAPPRRHSRRGDHGSVGSPATAEHQP